MSLDGPADDGRQGTSVLKEGMRFNKEVKKFTYDAEADLEDKRMKADGESDRQRMVRICIPAWNSINPDLVFTGECQDDFPGGRLPTLDFAVWEEDNQIVHSYFQKPTKTPYLIMEKSAMGVQSKIQILANELVRRLSNVLVAQVKKEEVMEIMETFVRELKTSGYRIHQARDITVSGIRGWITKIRKKTRGGKPFYRHAASTQHLRTKKKLLSKESWYKEVTEEKDEDDDDNESPRKYRKGEKDKRIPVRNIKATKSTSEKENTIKSVMFVPYTKKSELTKKLRENEEKICVLTKSRYKIVERAGIKLQDLLTSSNPWKGSDCHRENCLPCNTKIKTGKSLSQDCKKRNVVYETWCMTCQHIDEERIREEHEDDDKSLKEKLRTMKLHKYYGESARSSFERGWEHVNDLARLSSHSHMLKHLVMYHEGADFSEVVFGMKVVRFARSSFERQLQEAVLIDQQRDQHNLLNSRSEFNRSRLPRLTTQMGDDHQSWKIEIRREEEHEDLIEAKIRELRKAQNKARLLPMGEGLAPPAKRMKASEGEPISIRKVWGPPQHAGPMKRNEREEHLDENPEKRKRKDENKTSEKIKNIEIYAATPSSLPSSLPSTSAPLAISSVTPSNTALVSSPI